ncbi:MAG: amino acid adenylation domain-containing protein, partial [Verrucomicrobia bacterium]
RTWLKARLPDYMVPSHFVVLDSLPLTPNGKIDRKALPAPEFKQTTGFNGLATPSEDLLAALWAGILKREAISRYDNFFDLGGHSLLATQLIARIRESFQVELPIRAVFEHPELSSLATAIEAAAGSIRLPAIEPQAADAAKVLSFAQQRLWFLNQFEGNNSATYNMPAALRLSGRLNVAALQLSLQWLVERHSSLRSYFPNLSGQAQVQSRDLDTILQIHDLCRLASDEQTHEVQSLALSHAIAPFDLGLGPLFKADVLLLDDNNAVLLLNMHHIISDGWSIGVFMRDWQHAYSAFAKGQTPSLPELSIQYSDYAAWQRQWFQGEVLERQIDYWTRQLKGLPELLELPADKSRPQQQSYQGAHYSYSLPATLSQAVTGLSREQGATVFMTLIAAFNVLLSRYSRQEDICIGSPIANRTHANTEDVIGFFVNTLVLRSQVEPQQSFVNLLQATRQTCLEAYAHQDVPFEMLVDKLQPSRSLSHSPLFQVMFVLQNNEMAELALPDMDISFLGTEYPIAKFDLTLSVAEQNGRLHCSWEYATDLFKGATIERMAKHFEVLLSAITRNPQQAVGELQMLTEQDILHLQAWNNTATDYPKNQTLVDLFESQAATRPDNIAVVIEDQSLSYRQLNDKANQLAHHLLDLKTGEGTALLTGNPLIAIAVERSLDMMIGLLAILKAGGAYLPIDPAYPPARIRQMLDDSRAVLLLAQNRSPAQSALEGLAHDCVLLCFDETDVTGQPVENLPVTCSAEELAYVIYTSGSTGQPKGVMVKQCNLFNSTQARQAYYQSDAETRLLLLPSFAFDAFAAGAFLILSHGGSLHLSQHTSDIDKLAAIITDHKISHLICTPSHYQEILQQKGELLDSLHSVILGGEVASHALLQQHFTKKPQTALFNEYGPTEATIWTSVFRYQTSDDASNIIGKPIANTRIYILDALHQPQAPGIAGELCIAGAGLASGYLNRPELTAEKFIEVELFGKTERIYKTGDLARWLPDGNLEFLGRIDRQIKLRGFRIELGEIEAVLSQYPNIKEAVVNLHEADGNKRLVAYITADNGKAEDDLISELRSRLKTRLPDYMIPAIFMLLDSLPLTPNGKIDRKALPAPELNLGDTYEAPRSDIEQQLARIWSGLLKQDGIGIHQNFFELGGDSILSIQVVARARQHGLQLTPKDLFEHQTIAELAAAVGFGVASDAEQDLITGNVPLTPIQHWFFAQELPEYQHFNQSILLNAPVDLNAEALRLAFASVLSHHDALRLRFRRQDGGWQQSLAPEETAIPFTIEELGDSNDLPELTLNYQKSLNLQEGPITRLVFIKLPNTARLFWCIHHLAVDGVSWRILQEDLHTAYRQYLAGQTIRLPAKTSSFKAWSERLTSYAHSDGPVAELKVWEALPDLSLPVDNPAGANLLDSQQNVTISFDTEETHALLREVPSAYNTRINDVLLTALALTLTEWTGNLEQLVDLEGHGRAALFDDIDLSRTVGWFTSLHPIVLSLPDKHSSDLGASLKAVKEQLRTIPNEGIGYGLLSELGGHKLAKGDILFNYLGRFEQDMDAGLFRMANETTGSDINLKGRREHLIDINGAVSQDQLSLNWSYSADCYRTETIERLALSYKNHLRQLIRHCRQGRQGATPSDFPLAAVSQTTLDKLYRHYPDLQDLYPLSPIQQGMLFQTLYEPESGVYFEQLRLTLSNLKPDAFKQAWQQQLERHPVLRSAFLTEHSPVLQVVSAQVPLHWQEHDWRDLSEATRQSQLNTLLERERSRGFNLSQAPLIRFDLIRLDERRYEFIQHSHHILMDGWCLPIMMAEVRDSYLAIQQGRTPTVSTVRPFRDYIAWLQSLDNKAALDYWQRRLSGFTAPTAIPILGHKTGTPDYRERRCVLDAAASGRLQGFSRKQRVTLNTIVQAAWGLLLSRYSGETDICFGITVSGRNAPLPGIEQMIGLFINTLPLRIQADPTQRIDDFLQQIQAEHQDDNRYAHSPLFEIQANSDVANGTALFDSLLVFENYPLGDALERIDAGYRIENSQGIEYSHYPLTIVVEPGETLVFKISYDQHRIRSESIDSLWGHLNTLLIAIADNPKQAIACVSMLTEQETQQLQAWNDTATAYQQDKTLVDLFEQQVEKTPDNIAVVFEDQSLSYRQLNDKANQLAHYLLGLKTETGTALLG